MSELHENTHRIVLTRKENGLQWYRCKESNCTLSDAEWWVKEEDKPRGTVVSDEEDDE